MFRTVKRLNGYFFVFFCMKCKYLYGVIKERLPPKASDSHWNESSLAALFKILQEILY